MTENRQLIARYLPKKHKARMNQMDTVIIRGGNSIEQSCLGNEIVGKKSIKSSEETGDEIDEFVHVILSELTHYQLDAKSFGTKGRRTVDLVGLCPNAWNVVEASPIIVKIHDADSYFVEKELFALNQLAGFENSVTKLCDFSCLDDKSRWKHMVNAPVTFCNHKQDQLHFIALEYIEHGEMDVFFSKHHSNAVLCSLFLQMELAIITLALDYHISHGDLNTGNILISATHKSRIHYRILEKEYRITSHGILPKFIDYGRCTKYVGKIHPSYILDDIYTCLSVCAVHLKDMAWKHQFQQFILHQSNSNHTDLHQILVETKHFFENI